MKDFDSKLYRIITDLSIDVGPGLATRAGLALDTHLGKRDIREVVIAYLVENARDFARHQAAKVEREATHPRNDLSDAVRDKLETRAVQREKASAARWAELQAQYEREVRAELFIEWTAQLLSTEIAMPDGRRTTWGMATVSEHRARHAMLTANASANTVNAARHAEALDLLESTGATCLIEALAGSKRKAA